MTFICSCASDNLLARFEFAREHTVSAAWKDKNEIAQRENKFNSNKPLNLRAAKKKWKRNKIPKSAQNSSM